MSFFLSHLDVKAFRCSFLSLPIITTASSSSSSSSILLFLILLVCIILVLLLPPVCYCNHLALFLFLFVLLSSLNFVFHSVAVIETVCPLLQFCFLQRNKRPAATTNKIIIQTHMSTHGTNTKDNNNTQQNTYIQ